MKLESKHLNWGAISAVVALVGIAAYDLLAPRPAVSSNRTESPAELRARKERALRELEDSRQLVTSLTWQVSQDQVGPSAMAWVSARAREAAVEIKAFRPQRSVDAEGLLQLNYLVTAEGSYPSVVRLVKAFEQEGSLVAVKGLQIASLDGATDTVRATVSLAAYKQEGAGG